MMRKNKLINIMLLFAVFSSNAWADPIYSKAIYDSKLKTLSLESILVPFTDQFTGKFLKKKGVYDAQLDEINKLLFKLNPKSIKFKYIFQGETTSGYTLYDHKTRSLNIPCFEVTTIGEFGNEVEGEPIFYQNVTMRQPHITYPIFLVKDMTESDSCDNYVMPEPPKPVEKPILIIKIQKPRLTTIPTSTKDEAIEVEVNGKIGTIVLVNGVNTGKTIRLNGKVTIRLDTSGKAGNKHFSIILKDINGNKSAALSFVIVKQATLIENPILIQKPSLSTTPTSTQNDTVDVEVNGKVGTTVFVNGVNSGKTIGSTGKVNVTLDTSGIAGNKSFSISLKDAAGNESDALSVVISKVLKTPEENPGPGNEFEFVFLSHYTLGDEVWRVNKDKEPQLVKTLNQEGKDGNHLNFNLPKIGNYYYFAAYNPTYGKELWRSNGTEAGTHMIKDIVAGKDSSNPTNLTVVNDILYFTVDDGEHGIELWKTDGTESNTVMVKDIFEGSRDSNPHHLINLNGTLLFGANDGIYGDELWKSNGTANGTVKVKDIYTGENDSKPEYLVVNKNKQIIYFVANDGSHGNELWRSDGTTTGTNIVKDILPGDRGSEIVDLINLGDMLYFRASHRYTYYARYQYTHDLELWKSNGIASGTVQVKDIKDGIHSSSPYNLSNINGTLYFSANTDSHGTELWKSDGTSDSTKMVADIHVGGDSNPRYMTNLNGIAYFRANDGVYGEELWKSDGETTNRVKDIVTDSGGSSITDIQNINGTLYFKASDDSGNRNQLWMSDGTKEGTKQIFHKY